MDLDGRHHEGYKLQLVLLVSVNSPPPNRRWLQVTAGSRIDRPYGRLHHVEVIVLLRGLLVLNISLPVFIGHIAAGGNPIASCPQVLPPIAFAQPRNSLQQLLW